MQCPGQFFSSKHRAREDIVAAVEILCTALQHQIDPELEGALVDRRAEGTVDKGKDLMFFRYFHQLDQVEDIQIGIGRRFGKNKTGIRPDRLVQSVIMASVPLISCI